MSPLFHGIFPFMKQGAHHLHQSSVIAAPTKKLTDSSGVLLGGSPRLTTQMVDMDRRRKRFPLQFEKIPRSGPPDDGIFSGVLEMRLWYVASYESSCLPCSQKNLFSSKEGTYISASNQRDLCTE